MQPSFRTVLSDALGVLIFRRPSAAVATHWWVYLAFGLAFTWLAGIGRYWDNPRAELWQQWGLGSLAYVFCLALFLWLIVWPLKPKRWSYVNVLVFLTLTSPPALLYAVPVEQFMSFENARAANGWFLFAVAGWRVALLVWFLHYIAGLEGSSILIAALLPLALIVTALAGLNLEHVVFQMMSGLRSEQSTNDTAYLVVLLLTMLAQLASPFLIGAYVWRIYHVWRVQG